jgi:hypothetical protein
MPRYIKDSTMSNYINGLKNGTRYRESGLVHVPLRAFHLSSVGGRVWSNKRSIALALAISETDPKQTFNV